MSLLQQDSTAPDDAAQGESFTKGTSHVVWATILATILVSLAIAWYVVAGEKPPVSVGQILAVTAYTRHLKTADLDAAGNPMPHQEFDQVLLFSRIRLRNQTQAPLFVRNIVATVSLDDGIHSSYAAGPSDYERLFVAYPELAPLHGKPLPADPTIAPGQTLDGDIVCSLRISRQQWDTRKALDYTVGFQYQPDLKLTPAVQIVTR